MGKSHCRLGDPRNADVANSGGVMNSTASKYGCVDQTIEEKDGDVHLRKALNNPIEAVGGFH